MSTTAHESTPAKAIVPAYFDADLLAGHYPFRRFPHPAQDPLQIKEYLQARGITRACISSLHAIFYTDPQQGNDELLPAVCKDDFYIPVAVINPSLPNWRRGLAKSREEYGVKVVRLVPSYHQYAIAAPVTLEAIQELSQQGLLVTIVKRIEDERMHHSLMKVPAVDNAAILKAATTVDSALLLHGAYLGELAELAAAPNILFDIAFVETINTLARATEIVPATRLLFGSHAPFFYPEAAISKVHLWQAGIVERSQVAFANLTGLLGVSLPI
jgi:uncharacterized protein